MALTYGALSNQLITGLSGDTKPAPQALGGAADGNALRYGALFFETDTFKWYLWNGNGWFPTNSGAVTAGAYPVPPTA